MRTIQKLKIIWRRFKLAGNLTNEFRSDLKTLTSSSLVIDVGANRGQITRLFAQTGAKVISFEPNKEAFASLEELAKKYKNVECHNLAAGICRREVKLYLHKDTHLKNGDFTQGSSLIAEKSNVSTDNVMVVNEIDFAEFVNKQNQPIDIIKIDIEGYEIELINHMLDNLDFSKIKKVFVETHENKIEEVRIPTQNLKHRVASLGLAKKFDFSWH